MHIIGIDPGITGAIATCHEYNGFSVEDTPTFPGKGGRIHYDPQVMSACVEVFVQNVPDPGDIVCYIENVHAMPGQGVTSMFNFGMGFGIWLGIIAAHGIRCVRIAPQTWKKEIAPLLKEKDSFRLAAIDMFPGLAWKLKRKKDIGRADALLIAEYGRRMNL